MSAQLSLDSLSGIDWDSPKLAQLEQFALDRVSGARTRMEYFLCHGVHAEVYRGDRCCWMAPELVRTEDDRLEWIVRFVRHDDKGMPSTWPMLTDAELEAALAEVFEEVER